MVDVRRSDTAAELARLRRQIASIERRFSKPLVENKPARWFIDEWSEGEVVRNEFGEHFQTERLFARHKHHGCADIGALSDLPETLLDVLGESEVPPAPPARWAFLDTETTGLIGVPGTHAFLIGVGRITPEGFRVRQFFMREYAEERSVLAALEAHLSDFDVLITYNGKTYDQPLLELRYRLRNQPPPFARLAHLDLLHGARRLWKLRFEDCRLMHLEEQILGVLREGDLPGEMIPYVYFEYVRSREAQQLVPIFHHNAIDVLTLACLTAVVPAAFRDARAESLAQIGVKRGEDLAGLARWLRSAGKHEESLDLLRQAVDAGLPDKLLFRALWEIAVLEKKLRRHDASVQAFRDLTCSRNEYRSRALEELAKHYERAEKNYAAALELTEQALALDPSPSLSHRKERLERRIAKMQRTPTA